MIPTGIQDVPFGNMRLLGRFLRSIATPWLLGAGMLCQAEVLVPKASEWRWRPGTTEASTPIDAWRQPGFVDMEFTAAPAPFWYGDVLPGGTQISGMQNVYGCVFLRRKFTVAPLSGPSTVEFEGAQVPVSGVLVFALGADGQNGGGKKASADGLTGDFVVWPALRAVSRGATTK